MATAGATINPAAVIMMSDEVGKTFIAEHQALDTVAQDAWARDYPDYETVAKIASNLLQEMTPFLTTTNPADAATVANATALANRIAELTNGLLESRA